MQILLGHESRNEDVAVLLIEHLDPNKPLSSHDSFHEPEIKAPNHNDTQNDSEWCHDDPVLNIIDTENRGIDTIINSITILIITTIDVISMILLEERIQKQSALSKSYEEDKQADVSSDNSKQLRRTQFLTFDIQMIVSSTIFAVDFLGSNDLGCHTIGMMELVFTITRFDVFCIDSQKLEILSFVIEILFQTFE